MMKVIIIGGDAAGMSTAAKLKKVQPDSEIIVYEKGSYLSYAACGLPYFLTYEKIKKGDLIARSKSEFEALGIRPILLHEVLRVMPEIKKVLVKNLTSGEEFEDTYDKLMIATGARPIVPPFPGVNLEGVFTLKTIEDGVRLRERLMQAKTEDITIIGGGAIAMEVADSLSATGKKIRIIEMADRILMPFDPEIAALAHQELVRLGVDIKTQERLESILGTARAEKVATDKGTYPTDVVIMAIGVKPATESFKESGIRLANNGAIIIDREMRTSIPDIYAAGDCAEVYNLVKEENSYIALGTTANKCGRIAGLNLAGKHIKYVGSLGSAALKVGDIELARTGLSENEASDLKLDYKTIVVETTDKPNFFPNAAPIWFKLIYENGTHRILGAQGAGQQGVVLRIDVFASAIANKMSTDELGMLDLCYAPPFSTVWDAIHITANAAK